MTRSPPCCGPCRTSGRVQILSRPTITTLDSQPASVNIGQITRYRGYRPECHERRPKCINEVQVGLLLGVTPRVTPDGLVVMEVDDRTVDRLDESNAVTIDGQYHPEHPTIPTPAPRSAPEADQTVVFAGLIESEKVDLVRGIPWLSDLPMLGPLFRFTSHQDKRTELLIILTPQIIRSDEEIDLDPSRGIGADELVPGDITELYGNVGLSARPGCWCGSGNPPGSAAAKRRHAMPLVFPDENPSGLETLSTRSRPRRCRT